MSRADLESMSRAGASWYWTGDRIVARILGSMKVVLDPQDHSLTPHLVMDGFWESWVSVWCLANVGSSDRVLNIGANCGYYALLFAREANEVVAVEPQPKMADCVRRGAMLNGFSHLRVAEVIAGAETRQGVALKTYSGLAGSAHVVSDQERDSSCIFVDEVRSGELLPGATCVFMDAEGHEPHIWDGLGSILNTARWICMEWSPQRYADTKAFLAKLRQWGDISGVTHDGLEAPMSDAALLSNGGHGSWETIVVRRRRA